MKGALAQNGYCIVDGVASPAQTDALIAAIGEAPRHHLLRGEIAFGARNLLAISAINEFARTQAVREIVHEVLGPDARLVRGLFFDKTLGANWPVAWHQDLPLALRERREIPGWMNWSTKEGVIHAQPPAEILERILTLRLHLDDCRAENGPLRVLAGTHRHGRLTREALNALRAEIPETICCAAKGAALVMRPLLLHASSAAKKPSHRRVLHLEFAPLDLLPLGLDWAFA